MRGAGLRRAMANDSPAYLLISLYVGVMALLFGLKGLTLLRLNSYLVNIILFIAGCLVILVASYLFVLARDRPDRPLRYTAGLYRQWRLGERVLALLPFLLVLSLFNIAFSASKSAIHLFNGYEWDGLFIRMDLAIHGQDAWRLIQPLIGYPLVSFLLNMVYHLWILLLYIAVPLVCLWIERPALRLQFLIAYLLSWILFGTGLAILFASVGPCFVDDFFGNHRFKPLMDYLAYADTQYPILVLDVQKELVDWHMQNSRELGRGISAMPSMHVSIACLFAIIAWRFSRTVGIAATVFLMLILIGSVHLGYHYAVDGYLSIVLTPILWWVAGRLVQRTHGMDSASSAVALAR